ncbi:MAG: hypothetical protein Fur0022_22050 [Anaerolineales bacterium]
MKPSPSPQEFFVAGGTLWSEAPSYITRPVDDELLQLTLAGEYCNVLAARQMGKSSLMVRTARQLQRTGVRTAIIDISTLGGGISTPAEWFFGFLDELTIQLDLDVDFPAWWEAHAAQNAIQRFSNFLRDLVLTEIQTPTVIFIDEIDSALGMAFTDDFFAAIRGAYNARATHPAFLRLTFVLIGVARPADLIRDRTRTPYNIGISINLRDFLLPELRPFQEVFDKAYPGQGADILQWILEWTNGQPYLTQKLCAALVNDSTIQRVGESTSQQTNKPTNQQTSEPTRNYQLPITQLLSPDLIASTVHRLFFTDEARKESNLRAIRDRIESSPYKTQMLEIYARILRGKPVPDEERNPAKNELKLTGLVRPTPSGHLEIRNRIYRQVFDAAWVQKNLPRTRSPQVALFASLVAILALFIAAYALYQQRLQSTRTYEDQFTASNSPDVKLTSLARLLALNDPAAAQTAHTLYTNLPHADQLTLFTDLSDPQNLANELVIVIRTFYQDNPNTPEGNETLNAIRTVLGEIGAPGAPSLKTEIEFWLKGRDEYAGANYATSLSFLESAWAESENRGQPNLAVRFDRALVHTALENFPAALEDFQAVWEQVPARQGEIVTILNANPNLAAFSQQNSTRLPAALLAYLTPVPPSATPTPSPTPPLTLTPSLTPPPTPPLLLTPTNEPTNQPPLSPYNGWIAYAFGEATQREIYLFNPRTRFQQQITSNGFIDEGPAFSPDNWQIIYASNRAQNGWEIYAYDLQRGTEQQLTSFSGQARFPSWSPVPGDPRILFEGRQFQPTEQSNIWMLDAETGVVEQLTFAGTDFRPTWSPNGKQVLFGRATADSDGNGFINTSDNGDLFTLDLATRQETRLTDTPDSDEFNFAWSPDGRWIVFASVRADVTGDGVQNLDDSQDLFRVRADGGGEVRLDLDGARTFSPSWSPDGRFILYLVLGADDQNEVWRYDTQNGNTLALTPPGAYYHPVYAAANPAPAVPITLTDYDLAFVSDRDGEYGVYVMDTENVASWQLLPRPAGFERAWWPTFCGDFLAYEAQDTDGLQPQWIYLQTNESAIPIKYSTTLNAGRFGVPRCSPDGDRLAFSTYVPTLFDGWILGLNDFANGAEVALPDVASFGYVSWSNLDSFYLSMTIQDGDFYVLETANVGTTPTYRTLAKGKYPALSPTGNQYIYLCSDQSFLCLQNVAGGDTKLVYEVVSIPVAGESVPATAMWAGDGLWIYFASAADGDWDIYRVRPDGSEVQNLTVEWPSNELMPALQWGE